MGRTKLQLEARRHHRETRRAIAGDLRRMREDAGLRQSEVARAAGIGQSALSMIEAGLRQPSLETLHLLAQVLGCDLSVRLYPNSGPAIRDRFQARIVEALLRVLDPRWAPFLEVPVHRPVRGVIDVVLLHRAANLLVATEVHSELRRVEQQLRWAHEKADALANTDLAAAAEAHAHRAPTISRLLILRSTAGNRRLVRELDATFSAEFPADPVVAFASLSAPDAAWPGPALVWASADGARAGIVARTHAAGTARTGFGERPLLP